MVHFHRPAAKLVVALLIIGCAGPSVTVPPTVPTSSRPTSSPASQPTPSSQPPRSAAPTTSTVPTPTDQPTTPSTPSLTPAPTPIATGAVAWTELGNVGVGPSAREDHTWTIGLNDAAYLFGGRGADGPSSELWQYDLATDAWALVQPAGEAPAPRFGHTATWVPPYGLVVWSGQGDSGFFDDVWAYEPVTNAWRELPSLGAVPAARYGSCASLGPDGELWISHGFTEDSGRFADTRSYEFASGTWTDRTPFDSVPVERCLHDCFWAITGQLILYGGQTTGVAALGDVWAYDVASGAWTQGPDPAVPARQLYALAADDTGGIVFGGGSLDGGFLDDTWLIGSDLELVPFEAALPRPPGRAGATLIFDVARHRHLLFGGKNADGVLGDLWELNL